MRKIRVAGALLVLGFGGVVFWTVASLIADVPSGTSATAWVYLIGTTAGYGLAGFAAWRWIVANWRAEAVGALRSPARLMAAASVLTAAGVAALTYQLYQEHPSYVLANIDLHYGLRLAGDLSGTVGFLIAAAGFWAASVAGVVGSHSGGSAGFSTEDGRASPSTSESENDVRI